MKKLLLILFFLPLLAHAQIITTIPSFDSAGTLPFFTPMGIARDSGGNIYIADFNENVIKKRSPSGLVTTIAGDFMEGHSGDGGPAIFAELNGPTGVAVDAVGNVYFTDLFNSEVRKIDTAGIITCFAGNSVGAFFPPGGYAGDGGPADSALLMFPVALAFDAAGNLYIAENGNNIVRKVNPAGIISTFAGNNIAGYSGDGGLAILAEMNIPMGVAADAAGNVYIADATNNVIRKVNASGIISTFAGNVSLASAPGAGGYSGDGGPATDAQLNTPEQGLSLDPSGNLYLSDVGNKVIRMVNAAGIISTFAGNGTIGYSGDGGQARDAQFNDPADMVLDAAGNMLVTDAGNNVIRKISGISGITHICTGDTSLFTANTPGGAWYSSAPAVAVITAAGGVAGIAIGTATIGYVIGADTALAYITVSTTPYAGVITGADSICLAVTNDTLSDTVAGGHWSTNSTTVNLFGTSTVFASAGGIDTIYYTIPYTCGLAVASKVVTVVDARPCCITGPDTVCAGGTVTLAHVGVPGGTWGLVDSVSAHVVAPGIIAGIVPGEDFVVYTVDGGLPGCVLSSYFTLEVEPASYCNPEGVANVTAINKGFNVFPNPATAEVTISGTTKINEVVITNYMGQQVYHNTFGNKEVTISTSSLASGIYLLRINGTETIKLVKE